MTTLFRRSAAAAATAVLMSAVAAVTTTEAAQAVSVTYTSWDYGTDVVLTPAETADVYFDFAASRVCGDAIAGAVAGGVPYSDAARNSCIDGVGNCVYEARRAGRAIGAVRFYADGTYKCLVR